MKISSICLVCIFSFSVATAQNKLQETDTRFSYKNSIQFEAFGHGLIYSLNYERNLLNYNHFKTSIQGGLSFYPKPIDFRSRLMIPISLNQLFSFQQHHIETGLGVVITQFQNYESGGDLYYKSRFEPLISGKIGYRYQRPKGRMQYKLLFTPLLEKSFGSYELYPLGAFSIGYAF